MRFSSGPDRNSSMSRWKRLQRKTMRTRLAQLHRKIYMRVCLHGGRNQAEDQAPRRLDQTRAEDSGQPSEFNPVSVSFFVTEEPF